MKRTTLLVLLLSLSILSYAQDSDSVKYYINAGIKMHDEGNYEAAILNYDRALAIDKTNSTVYYEKAFSLSLLKEFEAAIKSCQKAIKYAEGKGETLKLVYTTYGNALDGLKKPEEALDLYDEGLEYFPDFYQLYFNKGITLVGLQEYDKAILCFQNSLMLNPNHASSHNAIGRILTIDKNNIPSLMALGRFFILEPQGYRAELNLPIVKKIMGSNAKKTGKNEITINLDPSSLSEEDNAENNFKTTELILSLSAALDYDKKNKKKTEVELFMSKIETVCASLEEVQDDNRGFYWEYYVPYFIEMKNEKLIETFSYLVFASSNEKYVNKWLKDNNDKIKGFYQWSSDFDWPEKK